MATVRAPGGIEARVEVELAQVRLAAGTIDRLDACVVPEVTVVVSEYAITLPSGDGAGPTGTNRDQSARDA